MSVDTPGGETYAAGNVGGPSFEMEISLADAIAKEIELSKFGDFIKYCGKLICLIRWEQVGHISGVAGETADKEICLEIPAWIGDVTEQEFHIPGRALEKCGSVGITQITCHSHASAYVKPIIFLRLKTESLDEDSYSGDRYDGESFQGNKIIYRE